MYQDLNEISDGKIYGNNDMVRVATGECAGCHACCEDMGESFLVDPYDAWQLEKNLGKTFEQLLAESLELGMSDGMILPHLRMSEKNNCCSFLNEEGRCTIDSFRPGICRLFPLGRIYEEDGISYFLQTDGCKKEGRSKVKVSRWLDTPELKKYQQFLMDWLALWMLMAGIFCDTTDEQTVKTISLFLLHTLYRNA